MQTLSVILIEKKFSVQGLNRDPYLYNEMYHIYDVVVSDIDLFHTHNDYFYFLTRFSKYFDPYFKTYAYCLLPNHYHLLVRLRGKKDIIAQAENENTSAAKRYLSGLKDVNALIENQFSRCFSGLTKIFNKKHERTGPLFEQGTKRVRLMDEEVILEQMHYIHNNALKHGLVMNIEDWPHNSYHTYLSNQETKLPKSDVLNYFGGTKGFIDFHKLPQKSIAIFE